MHMLIRVLVPAEDKEIGLKKAEDILDELCGDRSHFDYYTLFKEEGNESSSGRARWGDYPAIVSADSVEGKNLIEEGMRYTKDSFMKNIQRVRVGLETLSNEELFEEKLGSENRAAKKFDEATGQKCNDPRYFPNIIKYLMEQCSHGRGGSIWLYDQHGEPIHNRTILDLRLSTAEPEIMWVVPADVHL